MGVELLQKNIYTKINCWAKTFGASEGGGVCVERELHLYASLSQLFPQ